MRISAITDWFPPETKPSSDAEFIGVYKTKIVKANGYEVHGFSYWSGKRWGFTFLSIQEAYKLKAGSFAADQRKHWCGLESKYMGADQ